MFNETCTTESWATATTKTLSDARAFISRNWPLLIDPTATLVEFVRDNPDDYLTLSTAKYRKSKWLLPLLCEWGEDGRKQISYLFGLWLPPQFAIAHVIAIAGQLAISGYLGIGTGFVDEEDSGIVLMYLNSRDAEGEDILCRPVYMPPIHLPKLPNVRP